VEVGGDSFPALGATKDIAQGHACLPPRFERKIVEEKDVALKTGRKSKAGDLQFSIEAVSEEKMKENQEQNRGFRGNAPETKMGVSLVARVSMENIKSVLFFQSERR